MDWAWCIPGFHICGEDKSQTLADCIIDLGGGGGGTGGAGLGLPILSGLEFTGSLEMSPEVCLLLVASCARIASWYFLYLSCSVDILSVPGPAPSGAASFADCMVFDTVFVSRVADSGLLGSVRFKLPTLSIKERFVGPWLCVVLA